MKNIIMSYDKEADVLYVTLGKPAKGVGREISSGIIKRTDPKTKKVVGFTVVGFSKKKEIQIPLKAAV